MNSKNRIAKFFLVFFVFGIATILFVIQGSETLEKIALFMPIIAITLFWGWVYVGEKNQRKKQ